jgi:hypothetical protein
LPSLSSLDKSKSQYLHDSPKPELLIALLCPAAIFTLLPSLSLSLSLSLSFFPSFHVSVLFPVFTSGSTLFDTFTVPLFNRVLASRIAFVYLLDRFSCSHHSHPIATGSDLLILFLAFFLKRSLRQNRQTFAIRLDIRSPLSTPSFVYSVVTVFQYIDILILCTRDCLCVVRSNNITPNLPPRQTSTQFP